jgi:hypothetical protein
MQLPYQLDRTPKGYKSGELLHSADLIRNVKAARQAITDIRCIINGLQAENYQRICVLGISHSATLAGMLSVVDARIAGAVLVMPIGDLGEYYYSGWHSAQRIHKEFETVGLSELEVRSISSLLSPMKFKPTIPSDQVMICVPTFDRVMPPELGEKLATAWNADLRKYPEGHISIFLNKQLKRDIMDKMCGKE